MKKNIWKKPKLIILSRNRPEESVLTHCKRAAAGTNPGAGDQGCGNQSTPTNCAACQARASS